MRVCIIYLKTFLNSSKQGGSDFNHRHHKMDPTKTLCNLIFFFIKWYKLRGAFHIYILYIHFYLYTQYRLKGLLKEVSKWY